MYPKCAESTWCGGSYRSEAYVYEYAWSGKAKFCYHYLRFHRGFSERGYPPGVYKIDFIELVINSMKLVVLQL
jgi:hypothetical protein